MSTIRFVYLYIFMVAACAANRVFDWDYANTSIWLSSGAYCPTAVYLNRTYLGYSSGFIPTGIINDTVSDTQGYVGVMERQKAIYVIIRGSVSLQNWIDDFDAIMNPYIGSTSCIGCYVHAGFSYAWNRVAAPTVENLFELMKKYPDYKIVVTGHSLGGAIASLAALQLQEKFNDEKINKQISLYTFGAPRFCNDMLAVYASALLKDINRITHYRDMVPHCPPYLDFFHISGEWYEDEYHAIHECEGLEDNNCSSRWYYTTVEDHMSYLGLPMGCTAVSDGMYKSVMGR